MMPFLALQSHPTNEEKMLAKANIQEQLISTVCTTEIVNVKSQLFAKNNIARKTNMTLNHYYQSLNGQVIHSFNTQTFLLGLPKYY
jgi:hypothetical protein